MGSTVDHTRGSRQTDSNGRDRAATFADDVAAPVMVGVMHILLIIVLIAVALYVVLCVDGVIPNQWNVASRLKNVPLTDMPTTNGFMLGILVAVILLLI